MNFHSLDNVISSQFVSCSQVDDRAKYMNVHSLVDGISSQFVNCSQVGNSYIVSLRCNDVTTVTNTFYSFYAVSKVT